MVLRSTLTLAFRGLTIQTVDTPQSSPTQVEVVQSSRMSTLYLNLNLNLKHLLISLQDSCKSISDSQLP
jgi:hypothetical protein